MTRYVEQLHAVSFTADELEVIRGGPEARRGFVDRGAVSLRPGHVQTLADYVKVIKQKKLLLQHAAEGRSSQEDLAALVEPWAKQLVYLGSQVVNGATDYVNSLRNAL